MAASGLKAAGGLLVGMGAMYEGYAYYNVYSASSMEEAMLRAKQLHAATKKNAEKNITQIMERTTAQQDMISAKQMELAETEAEIVVTQQRLIELQNLREEFGLAISGLEDTLSQAQAEAEKLEAKIAKSVEGMATAEQKVAAARHEKTAAQRMLNPMNLPLFKNLFAK